LFSQVGVSGLSAASRHRTTQYDSEANAAPEPDLERGDKGPEGWTFEAQCTHQHSPPLVSVVVHRAQSAGRVRRPAEFAQGVHDETGNAVDPPGRLRLAVAPCLPSGGDEPQPDVGPGRDAESGAQVSGSGTRVDVVRTRLELESRRPATPASLTVCVGRHGEPDQQREAARPRTPRQHRGQVARSRHSASV